MCVTTQQFWRSSSIPHVELRSTYDSKQPYKPHFHSEWSFGALICGDTRANCSGREYILGEGDLVLIAPHTVHSCNPIAQRPRSYHMFYVNDLWCVENLAALRGTSMPTGGTVIRSAELFAEYLKVVAALPKLTAAELTHRLKRLLAAAAECAAPAAPQTKREPLAERIRSALLDDIATPIALDALADVFGCRKETLIRAFRRAFHITPHAFLNNVRVERAKERLKYGDKIVDVAADLGFSDQAQLHRAFVNYTASTPGQYRRGQSTRAINFRQESQAQHE